MIAAALPARELDVVLAFPAAHRVGDFMVRAVSASGRTGAVGCRECVGGGGDPFAIVAAPVISAGWRWARALRPELYWRGQWVENPAERWARLELAAGTAVNRASMLHAMRARTQRWTAAQQTATSRAWQHADGLQARALALWLDEATQHVIACTGIALMLAVHLDRELRLSSYVEG